MDYNPQRPAGNFRDPELERFAQWVETELQGIARASRANTIVPVSTLYVAPAKPRNGMIVYADGTEWNPGSGEGPYVYLDGTWSFIGEVAPPDLTPYLRKDDNLASVASAAASRTSLSAAARAQTEEGDWFIRAPSAIDYTLIESARIALTITTFIGKLSTGTMTATLKINGVAVTGGALSASSTQATVNPSAANAIAVGDRLTMTPSSLSAPANFGFTVGFSRTLS